MALWLYQGTGILNIREIGIYRYGDYNFFIDLFFDEVGAAYLLIGSFITLLTITYCRYYLHKEEGYKRFFNTILFFFIGYNTTVLSGNFETLFAGWEILGISSFLLIAFYRQRYLPVKNAVKVFSIYRLGDLGIILAMWLSHHLWHENITFLKLQNHELVHEHFVSHTLMGTIISLMILISAAAKSAQLPFSSWLPRAMEGPTPSSAIFYGSLSVHIGAFLLMRLYPFWENQILVRVIIALLGFATFILASGTARVQSNIKSLVAYSSIAQIGLIFIEIALGLQTLALIHFAGNAFLRTYQLLISPSVVSYLIKEQFYTQVSHHRSLEDKFPAKLKYTLYMLCLKEWNLDAAQYRFIWNPMKKLGRKVKFLTPAAVRIITGVVAAATVSLFFFKVDLRPMPSNIIATVLALMGVILLLRAYTEKFNVKYSWEAIILSHGFIVAAISFGDRFVLEHIALYLSGVFTFGIIGYSIISSLEKRDHRLSLSRFHGLAAAHKKIAFVFFLCCLALTGFPITPTFLGEDIMFSHIRGNQIPLACLISLCFVLNGLAIVRIFARLFMGPAFVSEKELSYQAY